MEKRTSARCLLSSAGAVRLFRMHSGSNPAFVFAHDLSEAIRLAADHVPAIDAETGTDVTAIHARVRPATTRAVNAGATGVAHIPSVRTELDGWVVGGLLYANDAAVPVMDVDTMFARNSAPFDIGFAA